MAGVQQTPCFTTRVWFWSDPERRPAMARPDGGGGPGAALAARAARAVHRHGGKRIAASRCATAHGTPGGRWPKRWPVAHLSNHLQSLRFLTVLNPLIHKS